MLTADEIRDLLRRLPDDAALAILAELHQGRVYEADRIALATMGPDRGQEALELVASLVRGAVTA